MPFYENPELAVNLIKIFILTLSATFISIIFAPILTHFLYKYKMWRKEARTKAIMGDDASVFNMLHKEREVRVPRFGGVLIWGVSAFVILGFFLLSNIFNGFWPEKLNFLSRAQTWLPLFTLVSASVVGLLDDFLQVSQKGDNSDGGLKFSKRLFIVFIIGTIGALWFYYKLDFSSVYVPLVGNIFIGFWYIPLFIISLLACWAGGVVDGIDGLAGGVFACIFGGLAIIAFFQGQINLAAFCMVIVGTILTFLWFNIPPARFYMGETGTLGLTTTLAVVAFLTDSAVILPIIAGILFLEAFSVVIQLLSKKIRNKKVFLCSPFHHHLEAKGWPGCKITMRFWIVGIILSAFAVILKLVG
jgi:phospho-N-acetylmuramoyl-pentapeptide-transferase